MYTTQVDYPTWTTKEGVFLPGDMDVVKYRYCVFSGGVFKRWEDENNTFRKLRPHRSESTVMTARDTLGVVTAEARSDHHRAHSDGTCAVCAEPNPTTSGRVITSSESKSKKTKQFIEWNNLQKKKSNKASGDAPLSIIQQGGRVLIVSYFLPIRVHKSEEGIWAASWDEENLLSTQSSLPMCWIGCVRQSSITYAGPTGSSNASQTVPPGGFTSDDEDAITSVLLNMGCHPIFLSPQQHIEFYDMYCKKILWPTMHHVADNYGTTTVSGNKQQALWGNYSRVNLLFKNKIIEVYNSVDLLWIHGFHLMLLPGFVRKVIPTARIGFFLHSPFPSSEIWRTLVHRRDLLNALLAADQIGFHLYEYARHFLATCLRLLGYGFEMNARGALTMNCDNHEVTITCNHVGIDLQNVHLSMGQNEFRAEYMGWKQRFGDKKVVAGVDRMERLMGVPLKLMAIEAFLAQQQKHGRQVRDVVFALIGISAVERGDDYRQTQSDVKIIVNRINSQFGDPASNYVPIYFEERMERDMLLTRRLAFLAVAHVLMMCPPRDGLNRLPMEYIAARDTMQRYIAAQRSQGVVLPPECTSTDNSEMQVILSLFGSATWVMRGSLVVNPWCIDEVAAALTRVLTSEMTQKERDDRVKRNVDFVNRLTTSRWASIILSALDAVPKQKGISNYDTYVNTHTTFGFGLGAKALGTMNSVKSLDFFKVGQKYREAHHRLILLDWGGTLVAEDDKSNKLHAYAMAKGMADRTGPTSQLTKLLEKLCSDIRNTVFVVSGKDVGSVVKFFGHIDGLGLGAEHGFLYRWPTIGTPGAAPVDEQSKWRSMFRADNQSWKEAAYVMMNIYTQRTHGAYIEKKSNALIWQFRDADPEFGYMQSRELEDHLTEMLATYDVEVLRGGGVHDGYIEVRPKGVSKGHFLEHALSMLKSKHHRVDFILTVGDDSSDEPMFEKAQRLLEQENTALGSSASLASIVSSSSASSPAPSPSPPLPPSSKMNVFTVTVGKKVSSLAKNYVNEPRDVLELLGTLARSSTGMFQNKSLFYGESISSNKKYRSTLDLSSISRSSSGSATGGTHAAGLMPQSPSPPADLENNNNGGLKVRDVLYFCCCFCILSMRSLCHCVIWYAWYL